MTTCLILSRLIAINNQLEADTKADGHGLMRRHAVTPQGQCLYPYAMSINARKGTNIEVTKSTAANAITNLDPGWSRDNRNDLITSPFPIVPTTAMKE